MLRRQSPDWFHAREHWVPRSAVGSLNGGEISHKLNREVVLMVNHPTVYERLSEIFAWDWAHAPAR